MENKYEKYITKNKNINRGYRNLEVWKEAVELFSFIRKKMKLNNTLPYKIKGQVEDSAFSVPSNVAEGYSRRFLKENIQFNTVALASLSENYTQFFALFCSEDVEEEFFSEYDRKHYSLENKLISLNKSLINKLKNEDGWKNDYIIKEITSLYEVDVK